jgi:hypothetical protein
MLDFLVLDLPHLTDAEAAAWGSGSVIAVASWLDSMGKCLPSESIACLIMTGLFGLNLGWLLYEFYKEYKSPAAGRRGAPCGGASRPRLK